MISLIVAAPAVLPVLPGRTPLPVIPVIWPARPADSRKPSPLSCLSLSRPEAGVLDLQQGSHGETVPSLGCLPGGKGVNGLHTT